MDQIDLESSINDMSNMAAISDLLVAQMTEALNDAAKVGVSGKLAIETHAWLIDLVSFAVIETKLKAEGSARAVLRQDGRGGATMKDITSNRARVLNAGYIYEYSEDAKALRRVEYIMKTLRECYVHEGWRLDEHDAARVVRYYRWAAEGQPMPDDDPEWEFVIRWFVKHGQSFDWVMFGDPRCMMVTGALDAIASRRTVLIG
jgi:hypothetical protein